jgi:hypothetical protein
MQYMQRMWGGGGYVVRLAALVILFTSLYMTSPLMWSGGGAFTIEIGEGDCSNAKNPRHRRNCFSCTYKNAAAKGF